MRVHAHTRNLGRALRVCTGYSRLLIQANAGNSERSFNVTCNEDGEFLYVGGFSSPLAPACQTCVAAQCQVTLDDKNGVRSPESGSVAYGEKANVTCNKGFGVKPSDYEVFY